MPTRSSSSTRGVWWSGGRHVELIALDGRYAEMWRRQQESGDDGVPAPEAAAAEAAVVGEARASFREDT